MIPPLKPITGWPGYFVSEDGQVYSTRDSTARNYKPVKVNKYGKVALHRPGQHKHHKPEELAAEAWRPRWYDKAEMVNNE